MQEYGWLVDTSFVPQPVKWKRQWMADGERTDVGEGGARVQFEGTCVKEELCKAERNRDMGRARELLEKCSDEAVYEVVYEAVRVCGMNLEYVMKKLDIQKLDVANLVSLAVQQNGCALKYASEEYQRNRKYVMTAVRSNGRALEYVSSEFKSDVDVVWRAVKQIKEERHSWAQQAPHKWGTMPAEDLFAMFKKWEVPEAVCADALKRLEQSD